MGYQEDEEASLVARRGGSNLPLEQREARWDGYRSIRIAMPQGEIGLATATYSYQLTSDERCDVARRMTALWNLAAASGWSTEQIEAMEDIVKEQKAKIA